MSSTALRDADAESKTPGSKSVSLIGLFRFSSNVEVILNFLGLVAAIATGAATPFMSVLFGNLISSFVAIGRLHFGNTHIATEDLKVIIANFRHDAKLDALKLIYLGLGTFAAAFLCISLWSYTSEAISKRMRAHYFRAVIHQDISFYDDVTAGEIATRVEIDAHLVQQGISEKFAFIASYSSSFVTGIAIAYSKSWRLSLALSAMLPCIILVGTAIGFFGAQYSKNSMDFLSKAGGISQEALSTIRTVHAFEAEKKLQAVFNHAIDRTRWFDIRFSGVLGAGMAFFSFIVYCSYSLSFYFGTTLLLQGHGNAGTVVTVGLSILIGSFSCLIVGPNIEAVMHAREAADRLYKVIDRVPLIDSRSRAGHQLNEIRGEIILKNVNFSYPSRPDLPILDQLNLVFPAHKTSALIGLSGSGKSTIVSLIERFYDVNSGQLLLDGKDVRELNIKSLRSQIGLVSQEPVLFSGSIRDNVALGLSGTTYKELSRAEQFILVERACMKAQAHAFITALPAGYDTLTGDGGLRLSGGQRQRIAIARAIVSDPKILLLDEATSALDTQSEGVVQAALTEASQGIGRTTIVIAHRLSTVKDADIIYVLGHGRLLEQGTHRELINTPHSHYSQLVSAQQLDDDRHPLHGSQYKELTKEETLNRDVSQYSANQGLSMGRDLQKMPPTRPIRTTTSIWEVGKLAPDTFGMYAWGTLFGILGGLVYPAHGIVYARALRAFENTDRHLLRTAGSQNGLWLFLIAIVATVSLGFHNVLLGKAAMILTARLRSLSFEALLKKDVSFFDRDENNPGTLTVNIAGGPEKIKGFTSMTLGAIIQCVSCCVGGSIVGLVFGWKLGLVGIACIPPIVGAGFLRLQLVAEKNRANKEAHNRSAQIAAEAIVAVRTVASLTCEDHMSTVYHKALYRPLTMPEIFSNIAGNAIFSFSLSAIFFAISLVFWYGSRLVATGEYSTFRFYVCFMTTVFGSWNAANVFLSVPDISSATDAARNIIALLRETTSAEEVSTAPGQKSRAVDGHLSFRNVSFRYPSRPEALILDNLTINIPKGGHIAFVGPSGSGKSTIIQLIERFYEPSYGSIFLDDRPIADLGKKDYRRNIALVSQDTRLYSGTIKFNILLGSFHDPEDVTEEEIREACRQANILEFIEGLPMGFGTQVGERGSQLSGGQKQRMAIARALIRNPKILLLDEATSALDTNSENAVQNALNNAAKGRTTIAIAHRLSTIQHADCIYFIQGGRICEFGTHSQLLIRGGQYSAYARLQQLTS